MRSVPSKNNELVSQTTAGRGTPDSFYEELLLAWNHEFSGLDASAKIEGSPERTATRDVVCDLSGGRWVLEQIDPDNLDRKKQIAEQLSALSNSGLERIHPWQQTQGNSFFQWLEQSGETVPMSGENAGEGSAFMLRPYVDGIPLNRETYLDDAWRIDALADFLIQLRTHSAESSGPVFSIVQYAENRMAAWRGHDPKLADKLEHSFQTLEKTFFKIHDSLPLTFCHGDYHPLNVVWGADCMHSVIDWEFCGIKPELYDAALLVGCIGFEDPDNLIREPVIRLVQTLRATGYGAPQSWDSFLDLAATIRFGWMSEWGRRKDREARKMESVYIDILVDQAEYIQQHWTAFSER